MFIAALFTIAQIWKQLKCPSMDEWIKMIHTHTHPERYYIAIKNIKMLPFVTTWMDIEGIMLSVIS